AAPARRRPDLGW
ncbi:hypothetical protein EE612_047672, partial [Oryza sativa]